MLSGAVAMALAGTVELVRQDVVTKYNFTQMIGTDLSDLGMC